MDNSAINQSPMEVLRPFRIRDIKETRIVEEFGPGKIPSTYPNKFYDVILIRSMPEGIHFGIADENNQLCWVRENYGKIYPISLSIERE